MKLISKGSILFAGLLPAVMLGIILGAGSGCSSVKSSFKSFFKEKPELSAEENYQKGFHEYDRGKYTRAIPFFQKILENYPFSIYAIPAELKIAESYFYDDKYAEAMAHLQSFEELHPTNEHIPYILYMKGVSYFEQFTTTDRDVTVLENAKREFGELITRFPDSPHVQEARPKLKDIRYKLAEHDFYVARFYYQDSKFEAALNRFARVYQEYPEEGIADRAIYYIGKCYFFLQDNEKAQKAFFELIKQFPNSPYSSQANMFLADIE